MNLKLDFCSFKASKFAVENYHYSRVMPAGKLVKIGVWEDDKFIGVVIFSRGANNHMPKHLGVKVTECCELSRVALSAHKNTVTKIIKIALIILKKSNPGIKIVFSYADQTNQNHKGIIYRAGNWNYHGLRTTIKGSYYIINGKRMHGRSVRSKWGSEKNIPFDWKYAEPEQKHFFTYKLRD